MLEALESRRLMTVVTGLPQEVLCSDFVATQQPAVVVNLDARGVLRLTGTRGADEIVLEQNGSQLDIRANGVLHSIDLSKVKQLRAHLGNGNDGFFAGDGIAIPMTIDGGAGNDELHGSDGSDDIRGGRGDDMLQGGLGADELSGGAGFDTIFGSKPLPRPEHLRNVFIALSRVPVPDESDIIHAKDSATDRIFSDSKDRVKRDARDVNGDGILITSQLFPQLRR